MLSTPPAFILSQDQTLRFNLFSVFAPVVLLNNFKVIYRFAFSLIFRLSGFSLCNFSIAWLFFLLFSFQGSFFFLAALCGFLPRRTACLYYHLFFGLSTSFFIFFIGSFCFLFCCLFWCCLSYLDGVFNLSYLLLFVNSFLPLFFLFPFLFFFFSPSNFRWIGLLLNYVTV